MLTCKFDADGPTFPSFSGASDGKYQFSAFNLKFIKISLLSRLPMTLFSIQQYKLGNIHRAVLRQFRYFKDPLLKTVL
jgi:hypothetical protein